MRRRGLLLWLGSVGGLALALPVAAQTAELLFRIDLRAEIAAGRFDPQRDGVGVRGAPAPLDWGRSLAASDADGDGIYEARLAWPAPLPGQPVAYKFKLERGGATGAAEGWEEGRNRTLLLQPGTVTVARAFGSQTAPPQPQRAGRIERIAPQPSRHVSPREVQVWLPPGYGASPGRRWPVLYLHDGQNVFDAEAAGGEWQVDETAQRLAEAGAIAAPLIVAVASGSERVADYTPRPMPDGRGGLAGGGAAAYGRYLVEELKPLIDSRYLTRAEPAHTALGGSSLGGLVSMWLLLQRPDVYGAALVVSPSVWWAGETLLADVAAATLPPAAALPRIWLDAGLREGPQMVGGTQRLAAALRQRAWDAAAAPRLQVFIDPLGGHDEASWAARVEGMLRFLYPPEAGAPAAGR
jgi:predicted alpha/beta superfamily hydrolase